MWEWPARRVRWINGRSVAELAPRLYGCIPKRRRKARTVADGLQGNRLALDIHGIIGVPEIGEYLLLWQTIAHTVLTNKADLLRWKWNTNSTYSAHSAYLATFHGSIACNA
jgi:hypothetical protein